MNYYERIIDLITESLSLNEGKHAKAARMTKRARKKRLKAEKSGDPADQEAASDASRVATRMHLTDFQRRAQRGGLGKNVLKQSSILNRRTGRSSEATNAANKAVGRAAAGLGHRGQERAIAAGTFKNSGRRYQS